MPQFKGIKLLREKGEDEHMGPQCLAVYKCIVKAQGKKEQVSRADVLVVMNAVHEKKAMTEEMKLSGVLSYWQTNLRDRGIIKLLTKAEMPETADEKKEREAKETKKAEKAAAKEKREADEKTKAEKKETDKAEAAEAAA